MGPKKSIVAVLVLESSWRDTRVRRSSFAESGMLSVQQRWNNTSLSWCGGRRRRATVFETSVAWWKNLLTWIAFQPFVPLGDRKCSKLHWGGRWKALAHLEVQKHQSWFLSAEPFLLFLLRARGKDLRYSALITFRHVRFAEAAAMSRMHKADSRGPRTFWKSNVWVPDLFLPV